MGTYTDVANGRGIILSGGQIANFTTSGLVAYPTDPNALFSTDLLLTPVQRGGLAQWDYTTPAWVDALDDFQIATYHQDGAVPYVGDPISYLASKESTTATLDAAAVRAAVGLVAANLDTQIAGIPAAVDTALANALDGTDLLTLIADKIAADWVAGDASPLAIVSSILANPSIVQLLADASTAAGASAGPDSRDLEPVQHVWRMRKYRVNGTTRLQSVNPIRLKRGDADIRIGFDCDIWSVLPNGVVLAAMTDPTSSESELTLTKLGNDATVAKISATIGSSAPYASAWVKTTVTNSLGGGPVALFGEVIVEADPS